jgi:hypothetical protein
VQREEAVPDAAPSQARLVKVHGRVFDVDTDAGIVGAEVRFYSPQSARLSDIRRRWHDRLEVYPDGTVHATGWPKFGAIPAGQSRADTEFGTNFTNETRLSTEDLTLYAPPPHDAQPIGRVITDASGEFEIPVPESLGFIVCKASGFATRERAVAPAEVNKTNANDVTIRIAMRTPKPLAGYIVDENLKRIERRVHLRFEGHVNKPAPVARGSAGPSGLEADLQMDAWTVETNPDGSFECALPAKMVYARCLEPDLDTVKQGHLRDGGTKFAHDVWPEPGGVTEPLVIVLQSVASLVVRDRETQAPIEDIHLQCTRDSNGFPLRFGRFFAPHGRMRLARYDAVDSATYQLEAENSPCECTVWADGYRPATQRLHGLTQAGVIEFDLDRGETPSVTGRIHDGALPVDSVHISLAPVIRGNWTPPGWIPIVMTTSNRAGEFRLEAPSGQYVLHVVSGAKDECRSVDLPSTSPVDVDVSIETGIVASVHDSSGAAVVDHRVVLRGLDGREVRAKTDSTGTARFSHLSAGNYLVQIMNSAGAFVPKPDQEASLSLRVGEVLHADFVIGLGNPRFARLVVDGSPSLAGWKACFHHAGADGPRVNVELDGRIPIDIRGERLLYVYDFEGRDWTVLLPKDAPNAYEIRIALDGLGYEGVVTSQATGRELPGLRIMARRWSDPDGVGLVTTTLTDAQGHFKLTGLAEDEYTMHFAGGSSSERSFERELIYVRITDRPRSPPARLAIALPKRLSPLGVQPRGESAFEGMKDITLSGKARKGSGEMPRITGFIASVLQREGYSIMLYAEFGVSSDGTYEVTLPAAQSFVASLRDAVTGKGIVELDWDAQGTSDHEVHDFELP